MNHERLESRPRIVAISAGSALSIATACSRGSVGSRPGGMAGVPGDIDRACSAVGPGKGSQGGGGIRLGPHAAREEGQPPPSDLLIGPEGDHIGTVAENHMDVVRHHRERGDLHAEEPGERLQAVPNPGSAMIVRVAREGIDPAEEGPAHDPLNAVIDPDLIRDHDLRAIPPCHAQYAPRSACDALARSDVDQASVMMVKRTEYGVVCPVARGNCGWPQMSQRKLWVAPNVTPNVTKCHQMSSDGEAAISATITLAAVGGTGAPKPRLHR